MFCGLAATGFGVLVLILYCSHDLWLGLIGLKNGKVGYIENPLIKHRVGFHNNSTACKKSQNTILFRIKYRILTLLELLKRT